MRAIRSLLVDLDQSLYALDSTTIDLCLSLFPWARFRQHKAAVKLHTLLDLQGNIPTFLRVTAGAVHDVNILDEIVPEAGAFYVMDRGYIDFERLFVFTLCSAFFVVPKENVLLQRRYSIQQTEPAARSDHTVILTTPRQGIPESATARYVLRCRNFKRLKFLTNNFVHPHSLSLKSTSAAGRWRLFFNGSSSTCESRHSMAPAKTQ